MLPPKAREIIETYRDEGEADLTQDLDCALTMGAGAIKRIEDLRADGFLSFDELLPGETRE